MSLDESLDEFVQLVLEAKVREADVSDGGRVPHGSSKHIKDLESRIASLTQWRDKQRRGSESRANYSRLITRLRSELASARKQASKKRLKEEVIRRYRITEGPHAGKVGTLNPLPGVAFGGSYGYPLNIDGKVHTFFSDEIEKLK